MTVFNVHHSTTYRYENPVRLGRHQMMFRPRDSFDQRLLESRLAAISAALSMAENRVHSRWNGSSSTMRATKFVIIASGKEIKSRNSQWLHFAVAAGMAFGCIGCAGLTQLTEQLSARWREGDES